jgi:hypothetical protein
VAKCWRQGTVTFNGKVHSATDEVRAVSSEFALTDREALLADLQRVFDVQTAEVLLGVLGKVAAQMHTAGVTREDFQELKRIVTDLAEAQRRTEERMGSLELVMERLAKAQQHELRLSPCPQN